MNKPATREATTEPRHEIRRGSKVEELLERMYPHGRMSGERRRESRYPFPYLIQLLPVESDTVQPSGEPFAVVGKHISNRGIGFYHKELIPLRFVVAELSDGQDGDPLYMLVDLKWCRFSKKGWYEHGGSFVCELEMPVFAASDELRLPL